MVSRSRNTAVPKTLRDTLVSELSLFIQSLTHSLLRLTSWGS